MRRGGRTARRGSGAARVLGAAGASLRAAQSPPGCRSSAAVAQLGQRLRMRARALRRAALLEPWLRLRGSRLGALAVFAAALGCASARPADGLPPVLVSSAAGELTLRVDAPSGAELCEVQSDRGAGGVLDVRVYGPAAGPAACNTEFTVSGLIPDRLAARVAADRATLAEVDPTRRNSRVGWLLRRPLPKL